MLRNDFFVALYKMGEIIEKPPVAKEISVGPLEMLGDGSWQFRVRIPGETELRVYKTQPCGFRQANAFKRNTIINLNQDLPPFF